MVSATRMEDSQAVSTSGQAPAPTPASNAAPYAPPSSATSNSTGRPYIGLNLSPERTARAAAAETYAANGNAKFGKQGEGIAQTVGNAFEHGTREVRLAMGRGESDKCGTDIGIKVRGTLAEEIGRPENSVTACRGFGGDGHQLLVGGGLVLRAGADDVAEPAQREACGLGHSHNVPAAGHGVAEGVETAEGIADGRIGGGEDDAGGADGGADGAGLENSHADRACALIAGAGNDGRAGDETVAAAADLLTLAQTSADSNNCGSHLIGTPEASAMGMDQRRWVTSSSSVPEASCTSMA